MKASTVRRFEKRLEQQDHNHHHHHIALPPSDWRQWKNIDWSKVSNKADHSDNQRHPVHYIPVAKTLKVNWDNTDKSCSLHTTNNTIWITSLSNVHGSRCRSWLWSWRLTLLFCRNQQCVQIHRRNNPSRVFHLIHTGSWIWLAPNSMHISFTRNAYIDE